MLMMGWPWTGAPVVARLGGTVSLFGGAINLLFYRSVAALAACLLIWASSWILLTRRMNCTYGPVLVVIKGPVYIEFMSLII